MNDKKAKILTKKCTQCGETKPVGEGGDFYKKGKKADGSTRWRSECKTCKNQYSAKYRVENREAIAEYKAKYYVENLEAIYESKAKYYAENRESIAESKAKYCAENPQADGLNNAVKRSTLSDDELFDGATRKQVMAETKFDYILRNLMSEKMGVEYHVDHIIPLDKGGIHRLSNLRVIPAALNKSKRNRLDEEWFGISDNPKFPNFLKKTPQSTLV